MPKKSFVQARPFAVLGIILLIWLFLPAVLKSWLNLSFFEMQAPALVAASSLRDVQDYWVLRTRGRTDLIEGVRDLARLNAAYELRLNEHDLLRQEISRLEKILDLPSVPDHRYVVARVARRDMNGWWQQIVIRKGSTDGIVEGSPVLFTGGVVGRVRQVYNNTATVELLSSPHMRLAAVLEGDNRPVSYRGGINPPIRPPLGIVEYVPSDITFGQDRPRRLLTSGLGGVFPAGIVIGRIGSLEASPDGLFRSGEVILDTRLNSLKEVAVLVPLRKEHLASAPAR